MKLHKRVLKLHHFRNLGRKSPTKLLLNSSFENKHGGLVVLVGENNVGKSNVLEALKIFNDADVKLCSENDYFKTHEKNHEKDTLLSLEEETSLDHKITDFSCVDLRIQSKEVSHNLKELSKTLIVYPFSAFIGEFIKLVMSYGILDSFLKFYKEKLKLGAFATRQADNLLFKKLIKHLSGNNQLVKNLYQCIREIIKYNAPNKEYKPNQFFIIGKGKQKQLSKIYSHFKKLSEGEIKPQNEGILKKLKSLDEIFKTTDFTRFTPKTEIKDIIKEIDEKYPINENFKRQFRTFRSSIGNLKKKINSLKYLEKTREDFERKKESWIKEIENDCKNECNSEEEPEYKINDLLKNIQQICKNYIESHAVNDVSKDIKYMMCQFYLKQIDLLVNSEIVRYRYSNLFEPIQRSLWESIKILDNESGIYLFPKNIGEIKDKFEANKEKFKQSKNVSEFAEYCRECNPYTAFNFHLNINNGLSHQFEKFVPIMKEYKEPKITDNDLEAISTKETGLASQLSGHWFFQLSLFNKTNFNPNKIWIPLEFNKRSKIKFDKDLEIYFDSHESFNISKKYLQEIDQESLKKIKQSKDFFPIQKIESKHDNNDILQLEFFENDTSFLFAKGSFAEILEYNMQLKIDSLITKEFNKLLAIVQDSPQDSYQLKIRVRHNNKLPREKYTEHEIKLEVYDCRKSHDHNEPIILSQQSTGFQWAFNFMFGFLYNVGSHFSFNHNIIYVMDEPATHLSVPARKEFRKFLKEYAHKNHVTFVLATHDPFLVDTDHLDEIRIVEKETEGSVIKNHFNYPLNNAIKDSDALDKIKRSLGVGQHVFHNPQKHRIIFVEGITDYCYLSAFKLYFNKHNPQFKDNPISFTFLPISGLKKDSKHMKETIQKLCELDNHPIVLTDDDRKCDSDQNATSERFKRANKYLGNPITILQLSDCDRHFKQIEDCFSANDRNKYAKNKRMELSMAFKTTLLYSEQNAITEETKNNFLCLFEWMKKRVQQPND
ncbi:AAA family ATPase [Helicobacter pylori]|uniref:AAA family ATPase n=1 Tax=Helicobacter pylori TaxID=210 RepID=UPI002713C9E9|nr:AAA family ATPase [Helicobacter pylori]MDO7807687.1 AAA family ATPase [Helicobacter pylori]